MFSFLPILMYHSISRFSHRLCVSPELFEDHCRALTKAGWRGVSLEEAEHFFLRKRRLPRKTCLLTFDDGYLDNYVHAEPILREYGHQGVVFTVNDLLDKRDVLRPARDEAALDQEGRDFLRALDSRSPVRRDSGYKVSPIVFCSWREAAAMRQRGVMDVAPHSMRHDRVIVSLSFSKLYRPHDRYSFFDVAPQSVVWGMPRFPLKYGLAHRGYQPTPELTELVRRLVPQDPALAREFLAKKKNHAAVVKEIRKLPQLGVLESEERYRARLAEEFAACRKEYEERLGGAPISFCWPWGGYTPTALEEGRKAGFRVFFTTRRGVNFYGNADAVRRFAVRSETGEAVLRKTSFISALVWELPLVKIHKKVERLRADVCSRLRG